MGQLITFNDQYKMAQSLSHFSDDTATAIFKRDINTGCVKLLSAMHRSYLRRSRFADLKASQQYYQYPQDAYELRNFVTHIGSIARDMKEVVDEDYWIQLNKTVVTGIPALYFVRGFDEVGLYPIPATDTSSGGELIFTQRHVAMTKDDYTDGSVSVTNGSLTITGSGTNFTQNMVDRAYETTDGSDGNWYRVASVESTVSLTLENYYQGTSGSGLSYRIGESALIPEEFQNTPVDYALERFYLGRDQAKFNQYEKLFNDAVEEVRSQYGRRSNSNVIDASRRIPEYDPLRSNISINT